MLSLEELTQQLWQASEKRRGCRVSLSKEPLPRVIHPYGICKTSKNQIMLVCWQTSGFTKAGGKEGYRNLALDRIIGVEMLAGHFQKRTDFNPLDAQYSDWVFHI